MCNRSEEPLHTARCAHPGPKPRCAATQSSASRNGKPSQHATGPSRSSLSRATREPTVVHHLAGSYSPSGSSEENPDAASRRPLGFDSDGGARRESTAPGRHRRSFPIVHHAASRAASGGHPSDRKRSVTESPLRFREGTRRTCLLPQTTRKSQGAPETANGQTVATLCGPGRQTQTPESEPRSCPEAEDRGLTAGVEDTFPRFVAFRRNQMHRSLCAGLPPQRLPLSRFLTVSAVSSRCTLWLCFKPHPPLGFMGLQSFSRRGQP